MAFDTGVNFVKDWLEEREEHLRTGARLAWAVDELSDIEDNFSSEDENSEWEGLYAEEQPDINQLIGVRTKIAWLAGARRDMRTQYVCADNWRLRTQPDHDRIALSQYKWASKGLQRLLDIVNTERSDSIGG